jgi:hypothetical protein
MIRLIRKVDRIRVAYNNQLSDYNESLYDRTSLSNDGQNLIISNDFDPGVEDIVLPYNNIVAPVSLNLTDLQKIIQGWVNEFKLSQANIVLIDSTPEQIPCTSRLQNRNGDLYWDCDKLLATSTSGPILTGNIVQKKSGFSLNAGPLAGQDIYYAGSTVGAGGTTLNIPPNTCRAIYFQFNQTLDLSRLLCRVVENLSPFQLAIYDSYDNPVAEPRNRLHLELVGVNNSPVNILANFASPITFEAGRIYWIVINNPSPTDQVSIIGSSRTLSEYALVDWNTLSVVNALQSTALILNLTLAQATLTTISNLANQPNFFLVK